MINSDLQPDLTADSHWLVFLRVVEPFDKVLIALHRTPVHPDKLVGLLHGLSFLV